MAEEKAVRGVVVEFDFTALDGAALLFDAAQKQFADATFAFTKKLEALHLAGENYETGLAALFEKTGCRRDAAKAAGELENSFKAIVAEKAADAAVGPFKEFLKILADKGAKVVVVSRAAEALAPALDGTGATVLADTSNVYGGCKWESWKRACEANGIEPHASVAVTGSGFGVKDALLADLAAFAVIHDHVAYQDFGGADAAADKLDAAAAREVLRMLRIS